MSDLIERLKLVIRHNDNQSHHVAAKAAARVMIEAMQHDVAKMRGSIPNETHYHMTRMLDAFAKEHQLD